MYVTPSEGSVATAQPSTANRLRVRWAAIGAAVAVTLGAGTIATVDAVQSSGERLTYVANEPCRLMNTRPGADQVGPRSSPLPAGFPVQVQARGAQGNCADRQLPADAKALQLNVTPVNATAPTDVTFWPSGPIPQVSSVNPRPGPPVPNAVIVTLDDDGSFLMQNKFGTIDMVIDVLGFYVDHDHDDRYYTREEVDELVRTASNPGGDSWFFRRESAGLGTPEFSVVSLEFFYPLSGYVTVSTSTNIAAGTAGTVVRCSISDKFTEHDFDYLQSWQSPGSPGSFTQLSGVRRFRIEAAVSSGAYLVCDASGGTAVALDTVISAIYTRN